MGECPINTTPELPDPHDGAKAWPTRQRLGALFGLAVFLICLALPPPEGLEAAPWHTAAVALLLAIFWLTEALPIAVTALLPIVLFPTLGISPVAEATAPYANPIVFLFMGGFIMALAIERCNLHRRIAMNVLIRVGAREDLQIAGFMFATALLSMWVSNTATTALMLPVALSVVPRDGSGQIQPARAGFATALMLSIAYGASIGGISTLIGTPPNALFAGFMLETYQVEIGFAQWMRLGVPMSILLFGICWLLLTRVLFPVGRSELPGARAAVENELARLGPMSVAEKRVAVVFSCTALLWMTRPVLAGAFPALQLSDATIAIAAAVAFFVIPSGDRAGAALLTWRNAERLPWGVLLLFGGGLSLAAAVASTGLAEWIAGSLSGLGGWPVAGLILAVAVLILSLTELTSNVATTATFLPLVAALAESLGQSPVMFAIPAVLAASGAFMLPVATPPNAIVFGSGCLTIPQMVRAGFWLNVASVILIVFLVLNFAESIFVG